MKGSLLMLLAVVIGVVTIAPTTLGLEAGRAATDEQGAHLRHLSGEQPDAIPEVLMPGDVANDENHAWWHGGGGCSPGSRHWPRCKSHRNLAEEEPPVEVGGELPIEVDENHAPWHGGGRGCFPGSHLWPRCRGWGGRGDCFPGSRFWPRCKSF